MKIKHFFIAALLSVSLPAAADFRTVAEAYELALSDVTIPATPSSGITFRKCADCDKETVRVTPTTQYSVNGQVYPLKGVRRLCFDSGDRANTFVSVVHHLESDVVLSVSVFE